ncbi:broad specificity phosphatase PhoE [Paenibacillus castaneae]|nr:broad specificity phosphatase PhoE [Paenibacillus castaneae]
MHELEEEYGEHEVNILLSGHRCTTGCIGAYFEGVPKDGNILRHSSANGEVYLFKAARDHHFQQPKEAEQVYPF